MKRTRVELDALSGVENPSWVLTEAQAAELRERLSALAAGGEVTLKPPALGYRGFVCELPDGQRVRVFRGAVEQDSRVSIDADRTLERWLLETGRREVPNELRTSVLEDADES